MDFEKIKQALDIAVKLLGTATTLGQASDWLEVEINSKRLKEQQEPETEEEAKIK